MCSPGSGQFNPSTLDVETVKLVHAERSNNNKQSQIVVEMQIKEKHCNQLGNLHGGCAASLLDNITSIGLYFHTSGVFGDPWSLLGVSQSINIQYLAPAPLGSWIDIETQVVAVGKTVSLMTCEIWTKDGPGKDAKRLVKTSIGTHTKIDNSYQAKM
ncbi:Thioesterase/thiol ester dehydrase-isomerase [Tilletiaria anomala UBC 951]|uniref:Thioesterase/thiol ester dehydrase-isomerase n=1 Tax=Tilletiaria anomala (strain ATCC 24038 / CBS 436.72 / UBC 951) TaxID=1037660 RepID=A0A066WJP3_TILAU|nr:Thioesterase/thiol ester dehydrase-isomerase [Tilletiaria anomala UBC 951]KDN52778.1 Thioesterase/thiol ester dehydrase-isomerase [Tilletiaria anomala UBC 951]